MPDRPPPVLLAMILCDTVIRDEFTRKHTLVGVFSEIHGTALPVVLGAGMHIYAALTDGRGEYRSRLALRHLPSDQLIFEIGGPLAFQNPQQIVELNLKLVPLNLPFWGRYEVSLFCEDQLLGSRTLNVQPMPPPPAAPSPPA